MHACKRTTRYNGPYTGFTDFASGLGGRDRKNLLFPSEFFHIHYTLILMIESDFYSYFLTEIHVLHACIEDTQEDGPILDLRGICSRVRGSGP
jgi:hypothetical protein